MKEKQKTFEELITEGNYLLFTETYNNESKNKQDDSLLINGNFLSFEDMNFRVSNIGYNVYVLPFDKQIDTVDELQSIVDLLKTLDDNDIINAGGGDLSVHLLELTHERQFKILKNYKHE
jgi:hypothetical protein